MLPGAESRIDQPHDPSRMHPGRPLDRTLDRHHRIGARRDRRPGHDSSAGAGADREGRGIAGGEIDDDVEAHRPIAPASSGEIGRAHGEAIHHGPVPRRGIDVGDDRLDQPPPAPLRQPHAAWRKQAIEGLSGVFSGKAEASEGAREGEIDKLHAKIGQLVVERDFLAKAFGR